MPPGQLDLDDGLQLPLPQPVEDHHLIDPVQELRSAMLRQPLADLLLGHLLSAALGRNQSGR